MRIICNARFLIPGKLEGIGVFSNEIITRLITRNSEISFVLVFDRSIPKTYTQYNNVTCLRVFPPARHPFLFYWWFERSLPKIFAQYKADAFFSPEGFGSLHHQAPPSYITIHDLAFLHYPKQKRFLDQKYFEYFQRKYANHSQHIFTVSEFSKRDIQDQYDISDQKISVVPNACRAVFQPISKSAQFEIRKSFSQR